MRSGGCGSRGTRAGRLVTAWTATALALLPAMTDTAGASEVRSFRLQSQAAFLRGTLEGISVDALGTLRLAPRAERLTALGEPFVLSAAPHPEGWVVGTGNGGKVLLVDRQGRARELFATAEPEVFAVWVDGAGTVYAGSSPNGKVYRFRDGRASEWFAPGETYIWQLAGAADGALLAATGTQGKLFRIAGEGKGAVLWDSDDTHVRSLAVLPGGDLLAGTAGEGRIVRLDPRGTARTLYDGTQPEVVAFAVGPGDGSAFVALVASEASQVPLAPGAAAGAAKDDKAAAQGEGKAEGGAADATVVVVVDDGAASQAVGTRPAGFQGPRSEILRITAGGTVEPIARLQEDTVHSLLWSGGRLWIGTGTDGKLYTLAGNELVLANDVEERQIMALLPDQGAPAFATTNAAAVYRQSDDDKRSGTYTSPVLDAGQISRFGTFRWLGEAPAGARLAFAFRSGIAAEPDATWAPWSEAGEGRELPLAAVPLGRYFQWRLTASSPRGTSPALAGAEVSYLQENLPPRIGELTALDPGQILVAFNFNPSNQVYEPAHPNRDGIFTTLAPAAEGGGDERMKPLWKQGFRTLRWKAEDPNADPLTYRLSFRPESAAAWLPMVEDLEETHYSFDETALPDGIYRFRLEVTDGSAEAREKGLTDERVSEPVVVDHTVPRLVGVERAGSQLRVEIEDAWNPVREATFSAAGGAWQLATPGDGLLDGRREVLVLPAPTEGALLILRVSDAAFNTVTFDLGREAAR
jgi:hypothetical protein